MTVNSATHLGIPGVGITPPTVYPLNISRDIFFTLPLLYSILNCLGGHGLYHIVTGKAVALLLPVP